jgi:hypothetical protein
MQARRFSSSKHRTQRLEDDESFLTTFIGFDAVSSVITADSPELPSPTLDSDEVVMSTSVLFEEFVNDAEQAACSRARISIILTELIVCYMQILFSKYLLVLCHEVSLLLQQAQ